MGPATRRLSGRGPRPGPGRPTHTCSAPGRPVVAAVPSLHRVGTSLPRSRQSQSQPPGSGLQSDRRALLKRPSHRATRALTLRSARQATFGQTMRKACHMCSGCGFRPKPSARRGPKPLEAAAAPALLIDPCDSTPPCTGLWLTIPQGGNHPPSSLLHIHVSLTVSWDLQDVTPVRGEAPRTFRAAVAACRAVS